MRVQMTNEDRRSLNSALAGENLEPAKQPVITQFKHEHVKALIEAADAMGKAIQTFPNQLTVSDDECTFFERAHLTYRKLRALVASLDTYVTHGTLPTKGPAVAPKAK